MRALIAATVLLLPHAVWADGQSPATTAQAGEMPLLISDTSWNFSRPATWRTSEPVPGESRDDRFVEFTNPQDKEISEVRLHVSYCGVKGSSHDAGWMKLKGPFAAHGSFKVKPSEPSGNSMIQPSATFDGTYTSGHMRITEVVVVDSDGSLYQFGSDLSKVLSANISNFCPNY